MPIFKHIHKVVACIMIFPKDLVADNVGHKIPGDKTFEGAILYPSNILFSLKFELMTTNYLLQSHCLCCNASNMTYYSHKYFAKKRSHPNLAKY
jgi:hypothetical protein